MSYGLVHFRDEYGDHFVDPLLVATAERLGVDLASTESPAQLEGLQQGCARCESKERCRDWLLSADRDDTRRFCLNRDSLDRIWMLAANLFNGDRQQWAAGSAASPEAKSGSAVSQAA